MLDVYFIHGCSLTGPSCCAAYLIEINKASSAVPASPTWQDEKSSSFRQGNLNPSRARFPKDFLGDLHLCIYIYLLRSIYSGMSMLRWGENSEWNMGAKNGNHFRPCLTWYFFRRFPLFFVYVVEKSTELPGGGKINGSSLRSFTEQSTFLT